ncbi:hypothetical protein POTOM_034765 [Populus tomentosa]|uniref:NmrA-like domain-containing protein n=1 Tax=Populus tomentosa TaxID=118781 RepID=A0A8X7Z7P0_POPTO|nr:hypothetical protein POTOM_034765 [Populus tomentosa]
MASKILFIGGTGYIGKFIVEASAKAGHPTFVLVRESTLSNPAKSAVIDNFKNLGVNFLVAIKQVDVVISTVGHAQLIEQDRIIAAIKEAGNVKRFFPSEFGNDVDRVNAVEPARSAFATKANIRRAIEAEGIPYTYVSSNFFSGYFLVSFNQPGATAPPRDKVVILGDGNPKAVFNKEDDIATYTIKAVEDPRTLNKILYIKPPANTISFNDLVSLWEKKIGKTLERIYVPEEQLLKNIKEAPVPVNVVLSIGHSVFVKGDHTNFEIEPSFGVEASELYPDVRYTTVDEYLNQFRTSSLFIEATGYMEKFMVEASDKAGHATFVLVRESALSNPSKSNIINSFKNLGVHFLIVSKKQVDVVISDINRSLLGDQVKIIDAIKEAGNVKPGATAALRDKVVILGDGNPKAVFNAEDDIATYTIRAVDDPRTSNKILYSKSSFNIMKKIGQPSKGSGDQTNFEIEPSFGVNASELYPDVKCTTVDEYLIQFV